MLVSTASAHKKKINNKLLVCSFLLYLIFIIWAGLFKFGLVDVINGQQAALHISFLTRLESAFKINLNFNVVNTLFNIILFLPFGLYLPLLCKKYNLLRDLLIGVFISFGFEFLQGVTRLGTMDIMDVILNLVGLLIGSLLYFLIRPHLIKSSINIIQIVVLVVFIPILAFGIYSIVNNWDVFAPFFDYNKYPLIWK